MILYIMLFTWNTLTISSWLKLDVLPSKYMMLVYEVNWYRIQSKLNVITSFEKHNYNV